MVQQISLIGLNWHNCAKFLTFDTKVVEIWDKVWNVCFDELSNFVGNKFFVRPLVLEIIELIG